MATNIYDRAAALEEEERRKQAALERQQSNQMMMSIYAKNPELDPTRPVQPASDFSEKLWGRNEPTPRTVQVQPVTEQPSLQTKLWGQPSPSTSTQPVSYASEDYVPEAGDEGWVGDVPPSTPSQSVRQVVDNTVEGKEVAGEVPSQFDPSMSNMFKNSAQVAAPVVPELDTEVDFKPTPSVIGTEEEQIDYAPKKKEEAPVEVKEITPTPADGYVGEKTVTQDGTVITDTIPDPNASTRAAVANGVNPSGANYVANNELEYDPKTGIATVNAGELGLDFKTKYEYAPRNYTDRQALFQGLITGGLAVLGMSLAGGNSKDLGAAFFLAGANRFAGALNESARYKNIEALEKQGYTPQSIEEYIQTGDRGALKKFEIEDWKEYPDGSGRMYRQMPDGTVQFMKGTPKWETMVVKQGWKTKQRYRNPVTGEFMKDSNGNVVEDELDDGFQAQQNFNQKVASANKESAADKKARTASQKVVDSINNQVESLNRDVMQRTARFRTSDGSWKKSDGRNSHDPKLWALMGGAYGEYPKNLERGLALIEDKELRDDIINAKQIGSQMTAMAIQAARDAGASGINTKAEIDLLSERMPKVDYSSYDAMVESIRAIEEYTQQYLIDLSRRVAEANGESPQPTAQNRTQSQPQGKKPLYSVNGQSSAKTYTSQKGVQYTVE